MNDVIDDNYEDIALQWQYQMIKLLKKSIEKEALPDDQAKDIIGDFAFSFAMLHDQGKIKVDDDEFRPIIAFQNSSGQVVLSTEESSLHDYAFGSTSQAFCL